MDQRKNREWPDPLRALMMASVSGAGLYALWAAACALCFAAALLLCADMQGTPYIALTGALCVLIALWGARPALKREANVAAWLCVALAAALAVAAHVSLLSIKPGRYSSVIGPMLNGMWNYDLIPAAAWEENSWSGVYLFVCALVSRLMSFPQMTALKLFDMVCQFMCGAAVARLAIARGTKAPGAVAGMLACVLAPTMLMNAGVWLHCDATFAMFALWGLLLIVEDKPLPGCALWGLALGTKLQSAFLFPLLIPLFMKGKVSLRHLLALAGSAFVSQSAILLDRQRVASMLMRYGQQIDAAKESIGLGDNAPGVFGLMKIASVREFSGMGICLALAAALLVALALLRARGELSADAWLLGAWLLAAGLPLVLPQMNARCLYLAGMLAFALASNTRRVLVCVVLEFVSLCGYMASIFGAQILSLTVLSLLAIGAAMLVLLELVAAIVPVEASVGGKGCESPALAEAKADAARSATSEEAAHA